MALDFEEYLEQSPMKEPELNSQSIANMEPIKDQNIIEEVSQQILEVLQALETQSEQNRQLERRQDENLRNAEKTLEETKQLVAFFRDHKSAIQTSIYATSKFAIEEEAQKAILEIEEIAEKARKEIEDIKERSAKEVGKPSQRGKWEKVILGGLFVLLGLILYYVV